MSVTKTPITYYGGKQRMLKYILPLIPEHNIYVEPFAGGAAVYFAKQPSNIEVLNDINNEVINFYQVFKRKSNELQKEVDATLYSKNLHTYAKFIYSYPEFFTKVKRAWALWYLSKSSFASKLDGTFGYDKQKNRQIKVLKNAKEHILTDNIIKRLENTQIECNDALKIIKNRDTINTFIFADPPYVGSNQGHYSGYNDEHFKALLDILASIKGKFMLTMYPNKMLKSYIDKHKWHIHSIERTVSAAKTTRRKQEEWIVMNYLKDPGR